MEKTSSQKPNSSSPSRGFSSNLNSKNHQHQANLSKKGEEKPDLQKSKAPAGAPPGSESRNVRRVIRIQSLARRHLARKKTELLLKEQRSRAAVVREIVTTERTYVEILRQINEYFLQPLLQPQHAARGPMPPSRDVNILFPHIQVLLPFHQQLAADLEQRFSGWSAGAQVGDILLKLIPFMDNYTLYACAYPQALQKLAEWRHQSRGFIDFIEAALFKVHLPKGIAADIHSLLICPVQRPPRLTLLIAEALKFTETDHPDHELLSNALAQLKQTVERMEQIAEETHSTERIRQIFDAFESKKPNLPSYAARRWIKDGELNVYNPKSKKLTRKAFVLLSDCLIVCESRKSNTTSSSSSSASAIPIGTSPPATSNFLSIPSTSSPPSSLSSSPNHISQLSTNTSTATPSSSSQSATPSPSGSAISTSSSNASGSQGLQENSTHHPSLITSTSAPAVIIVPPSLPAAPSSASLSGTYGQIPPLKYKRHVMLHRLCVGNRLDSEDGRAKFAFELSDFSGIDMRKSMIVCADTAQDKAAWLDRLANASEKYKIESEQQDEKLTKAAREKAQACKAAISQRYHAMSQEAESLQEMLLGPPSLPPALPPVLSGTTQRSSLRGANSASSVSTAASASKGIESSGSSGNTAGSSALAGLRAFALRRADPSASAALTRQRSGSLPNVDSVPAPNVSSASVFKNHMKPLPEPPAGTTVATTTPSISVNGSTSGSPSVSPSPSHSALGVSASPERGRAASFSHKGSIAASVSAGNSPQKTLAPPTSSSQRSHSAQRERHSATSFSSSFSSAAQSSASSSPQRFGSGASSSSSMKATRVTRDRQREEEEFLGIRKPHSAKNLN